MRPAGHPTGLWKRLKAPEAGPRGHLRSSADQRPISPAQGRHERWKQQGRTASSPSCPGSIGCSEAGLDGQDSAKSVCRTSVLRVDDLRTDKHWTFERINFSINRPGGGISCAVQLDDEKRPWPLRLLCTKAACSAGRCGSVWIAFQPMTCFSRYVSAMDYSRPISR